MTGSYRLFKKCGRAVRWQPFAFSKDSFTFTGVSHHDRYRVTDCPLHERSRDGRFSEEGNGPVQYGASLQALVVVLNTVGAVSIARAHEILANVFATIKSMVSRCAGRQMPESAWEKLAERFEL